MLVPVGLALLAYWRPTPSMSPVAGACRGTQTLSLGRNISSPPFLALAAGMLGSTTAPGSAGSEPSSLEDLDEPYSPPAEVQPRFPRVP